MTSFIDLTWDDLQKQHEFQSIPEVLFNIFNLSPSFPQVGVTPGCEGLTGEDIWLNKNRIWFHSNNKTFHLQGPFLNNVRVLLKAKWKLLTENDKTLYNMKQKALRGKSEFRPQTLYKHMNKWYILRRIYSYQRMTVS